VIFGHVPADVRAVCLVTFLFYHAKLVELRHQLSPLVGNHYIERIKLQHEIVTDAAHQCTNPTVSVRRNSWPPVSRTRRVIVSSVAKNLSSARLLVLLVLAKRLSKVDLPAFV
jgi:hypothetical protein